MNVNSHLFVVLWGKNAIVFSTSRNKAFPYKHKTQFLFKYFLAYHVILKKENKIMIQNFELLKFHKHGKHKYLL